MLILTRKAGESVLIGDDIEVFIKEVGKQQVRIGIVAPSSVTIRRRDLRTPSDVFAVGDRQPETIPAAPSR